jgi:hypothetical protein
MAVPIKLAKAMRAIDGELTDGKVVDGECMAPS